MRFKQYIPSKPAKYGLKVWAIVDVGSKYICILEPYVGKQSQMDQSGQPNPLFVSTTPYDLVVRMMQDFARPGKNLTGDNWFTSIPLVDKLLKLKTTYVGTIRKNKSEIPIEFQASNRKEYSSMFGFRENMTMVSYVPKKNRTVILVSSQHYVDKIDPATKTRKKPDIVTNYNANKCGVDVVDQMCSICNVQQTTRRWPWVHMFNLINVSAINARVIFEANTKQSIERTKFLDQLGEALYLPHLKRRAVNNSIPYKTSFGW